MTGNAELSNEEGIEGRVECSGNFGRDGNAAARKSQHDDVGTISILAQVGRELLAGVGTAAEWDRHRPLREGAAAVDDADARTAWRRVCISQRAMQVRGQGEGSSREGATAGRWPRLHSVPVTQRRRTQGR